MTVDIKEELNEALMPISRLYTEMIMDAITDIELEPTTIFKEYQIYKVEHFNPRKPIVFYVGFASGKSAFFLTDHPENYINLAEADNVIIQSSQLAIEYVINYLKFTDALTHIFYLVNSVDEIEFNPDLDAQELQDKTNFLETYHSVITEPIAQVEGNDYLVTAYAVNENSLVQYDIRVKHHGEIITETKILASNLPILQF